MSTLGSALLAQLDADDLCPTLPSELADWHAASEVVSL